jgi:hypothetical protein
MFSLRGTHLTCEVIKVLSNQLVFSGNLLYRGVMSALLSTNPTICLLYAIAAFLNMGFELIDPLSEAGKVNSNGTLCLYMFVP